MTLLRHPWLEMIGCHHTFESVPFGKLTVCQQIVRMKLL
jgi:uncharacterized membrane protein YjdF